MKVLSMLCMGCPLLAAWANGAIIETLPKGSFVAKLHSEVDGKKVDNLFIDMEGLFDGDDEVYNFSPDPDGKEDRNK